VVPWTTQRPGTSVASPIVASVYALAGNSRGTSNDPTAYLYGDPGALFDITSGSDGSCGGSYLCTAGPGYDGPTGLGPPNGTAAFTSAGPVQPGYSMSASPTSHSVTAGSTASYTVTLTASGGYSSPVSLSVSSSPSGPSGTFSPTSVTPTSGGAPSTLTVSTSSSTPPGNYTLTITGTGTDSAKTVQTVNVALTVTAPVADFTVSASPTSLVVQKGKTSNPVTITLTPSNGYNSSVSLTATGLQRGVTPTFRPPSVTVSGSAPSTSTLTFSASSTAKSGTRNVTVTATDQNGRSHTVTVALTVQ